MTKNSVRRAAGKYVSRVITESGCTQEEVALDSGLTQAQVSRISSGRQTPTLWSLLRILQAAGGTLGEFEAEIYQSRKTE